MGLLGYGRVSTDEQSEALTAQVARLKAAGCETVITDQESGRNADRDGLLQCMELVRSGVVTELVVTRLDRLGRDAAYADALLAQCEAAGVAVRALDGGTIETATPQGFLMARLQTSLAEMESRMLSMRIRRQFAVYRTEGRHLRRRKPFGYRGGADHKLVPDPDQWPQALRVIEELRQVGSFSGVAHKMPTWCKWTPAPGSLQHWFCNPVIRGHIGYGYDRSSGKGWGQRWQEIHYDQHAALIGEADWHELAGMLRRSRNKFLGGEDTDVKWGLTGLLRCGSCDHLMRRNSSNGVVWWRCRHRLCKQRGGIKEIEIMPIVIRACVSEAARLARLLAAPPDVDPAVAAMEEELNLMVRMAARNPSNKAMAAAVLEQRQRIEQLKRQDHQPLDLNVLDRLREPEYFRGATSEQQRALFALVLRSVQVGVGGEVLGIEAQSP